MCLDGSIKHIPVGDLMTSKKIVHDFHLPAYRSKTAIILSSYKVMYSFLQRQEKLERIFWNKTTFHLAALNRAIAFPNTLVLLRNPEARFISYFKDKFRKEPLRMIREGRLHPENLQHCQRLWLNHVGVPLDDVRSCCYELIRTSADSVVDWLPTAYTKDCHTLPQIYSFYAQWRRFRIRLNVKQAFLIDEIRELEEFGKLTEMDVSVRNNSTHDVVEPVKLSHASSMLLANLYACDLQLINSRNLF